MSELKLSDVDVDGAIRESAQEAREEVIREGGEGDTRLDFFKKAGIAGGAVVGGGALMGALVRRRQAPERPREPGKGRRPSAEELRQGRHRHPQLRPDARVPRGGVLQGGPGQQRRRPARLRVPRRSGDGVPRRRRRDEKAHVKGLKGALGKTGGQEAEVRLRRTRPARRSRSSRRHSRSRTRAFTPTPARRSTSRTRLPRGGAVDRHDRGTSLGRRRVALATASLRTVRSTRRHGTKVLKAVKATGFIQGFRLASHDCRLPEVL